MPFDLALDLAHALDPVAFVEDRLGFHPDPWQARLLRSRAPWMLLNCCRQSGKSTTTAAVALHTALYDPGLILLVSVQGAVREGHWVSKEPRAGRGARRGQQKLLHLGEWCAGRLAARGSRHTARLFRTKIDRQRRSRLCHRRDAGGARLDAGGVQRAADRDVLAQRQARAFL